LKRNWGGIELIHKIRKSAIKERSKEGKVRKKKRETRDDEGDCVHRKQGEIKHDNMGADEWGRTWRRG